MNWKKRKERRMIRRHGGKPLQKYGYDGLINNKPVEVRSVRHDNRYRIQKNVHNVLVNRGGCYIFVNRQGRSRRGAAKKVSQKLGRGRWFKDRNYPHKFLYVRQVF